MGFSYLFIVTDVTTSFLVSTKSIKRGDDGKFADDDIANILHNATENPAGQYRARGTPGVLRIVEIMGIMQGRRWGVCTVRIVSHGPIFYAECCVSR